MNTPISDTFQQRINIFLFISIIFFGFVECWREQWTDDGWRNNNIHKNHDLIQQLILYFDRKTFISFQKDWYKNLTTVLFSFWNGCGRKTINIHTNGKNILFLPSHYFIIEQFLYIKIATTRTTYNPSSSPLKQSRDDQLFNGTFELFYSIFLILSVCRSRSFFGSL